MTTETPRTSGHDRPDGYDQAMNEARDAGEGGAMNGFLERIAERLGAKASVKAVFGEPIERDGITVIPVARIRYGFGGGAGSSPLPPGQGRIAGEDPEAEDATAGSSGLGGGGGATADPIGYIEIGPDGADFRPIVPAMPSPGFLLAAGATATLVLRGLARLVRR